MKKILITGAGSYIGTAVADYLKNRPEAYRVDTLDVLGEGSCLAPVLLGPNCPPKHARLVPLGWRAPGGGGSQSSLTEGDKES